MVAESSSPRRHSFNCIYCQRRNVRHTRAGHVTSCRHCGKKQPGPTMIRELVAAGVLNAQGNVRTPPRKAATPPVVPPLADPPPAPPAAPSPTPRRTRIGVKPPVPSSSRTPAAKPKTGTTDAGPTPPPQGDPAPKKMKGLLDRVLFG